MRNWGIVTNRPASSGAQQPQSGSHSRAGQRDSNVIQLAGRDPSRRIRLNSGPLPSAPLFILDPDDREFAAYTIVILFVGMPCLFLGAVYLLLT